MLARAAQPIAKADGAPGGPPQVVWASTQIGVDGEHIAGLSLSLEPGLTISGQVRFEGTTLKPPMDLKSIRVSAGPAETQRHRALRAGRGRRSDRMAALSCPA